MLFLITSIPADELFQPVLDDPAGYTAGAGQDGRDPPGRRARAPDRFGPGMVVGLGYGLILGWLLYRSGLVPRRMAMLGIIGGPILLASGVAVLFGVVEAGGIVQSLATVPEFLWELSLGVYLIVRGFARPPVPVAARGPARRVPATA